MTLPSESDETAVSAESKHRKRINTAPAAVFGKRREKPAESIILSIPERIEEYVSGSGMASVESKRSVPSIDEPNSGFQLLKVTDKEDNLADVSSLYSEPCYDSNIQVSGSLKFGVWYRDEEQILYVRVKKAKDLATVPGKDLNPYVKVHLLPDKSKHTKRKTGIQRKTTNPEFDEIVKVRITVTIVHNWQAGSRLVLSLHARYAQLLYVPATLWLTKVS